MGHCIFRALHWPTHSQLAGAVSLGLATSALAQNPPPQLPPLPPKPPKIARPNNASAPNRPPRGGNMNGLLDYMADVAVLDYDEIDGPAIGYGNEILWDKSKAVTPAVPTQAAKPERQSRKRKAK